MYALSVFLVFSVTISVYPAVLSQVQASTTQPGASVWTSKWRYIEGGGEGGRERDREGGMVERGRVGRREGETKGERERGKEGGTDGRKGGGRDDGERERGMVERGRERERGREGGRE